MAGSIDSPSSEEYPALDMPNNGGMRENRMEGIIYEFEIQEAYVGRLIGKSGNFVNTIKMTTGANVVIMAHPYNPCMNVCVIQGTWLSEIVEALALIQDRFPLSKFPQFNFHQICCYFDPLAPITTSMTHSSLTSFWTPPSLDESAEEDNLDLLDQLDDIMTMSTSDVETNVECGCFNDPEDEIITCDLCFQPLTEGLLGSFIEEEEALFNCQIWIPGLTHDVNPNLMTEEEEVRGKITKDGGGDLTILIDEGRPIKLSGGGSTDLVSIFNLGDYHIWLTGSTLADKWI